MKKRTSVTQKQIAQQMGVSQTLVSLVLNGSYDVTINHDTRQRVLALAEEMGYVPQAAAKSLVEGLSNHIAIVLVQPHYQVFQDPFIPNILTGLSEVVQAKGYRLIVEPINDLNDLSTLRYMLKSGEVAGIVLSNFHWAEPIIAPLIEEGYPIVLLDSVSDEKYPSVYIDHLNGVKNAIRYLQDAGHQRIGCITYGPLTSMGNRVDAVREALRKGGHPLENRYLRFGEFDPESGYRAMQSLLTESPRVTAVFGMNDIMALGAMRAILDAGLRIPEDIAVMGYDNMRFTPFTNPTLTTVHAPELEQGRLAGKMLVELIHGKIPQDIQIALSTHVMRGTSC